MRIDSRHNISGKSLQEAKENIKKTKTNCTFHHLRIMEQSPHGQNQHCKHSYKKARLHKHLAEKNSETLISEKVVEACEWETISDEKKNW